jgi:hypothetical protein
MGVASLGHSKDVHVLLYRQRIQQVKEQSFEFLVEVDQLGDNLIDEPSQVDVLVEG